jgi:hypothetical protein
MVFNLLLVIVLIFLLTGIENDRDVVPNIQNGKSSFLTLLAVLLAMTCEVFQFKQEYWGNISHFANIFTILLLLGAGVAEYSTKGALNDTSLHDSKEAYDACLSLALFTALFSLTSVAFVKTPK